LKGAGMLDYGMVVGVMFVTAFATVSTTGVRVKQLYLGLGEQVAYVNREIATINIAMDNSSGTWVIVDTDVEPVVDEALFEDAAAEEASVEDEPTADAPPQIVIEEKDAPVPEFRLTKNNGLNNAEIDFSKIDVPLRAYEFTISGTGDTQPKVMAFSDGSETSGTTLTDKIQIRINKPSKGQIETITLIIAGQTLVWTVAHDNSGKNK